MADYLRGQYAHGGAPYGSGTPNDTSTTFDYDSSDKPIELDNVTGIAWAKNYSDFCLSGGYSSTCCDTTSASPCGPGVGAYDLNTFLRKSSNDSISYGNASDWRPASADAWISLLADWKNDNETLSTYLTSGPPGFTGGTDQRVFFTGDTDDSSPEVDVLSGTDEYVFQAKEVACFVATPLSHGTSTQPFCKKGFGNLMHAAADHTTSKSPCYNANSNDHASLSTIQSPFFDLLYNIQKDKCDSSSHPQGQTFYAGPPGWLLKYRSFRGNEHEDTGVVGRDEDNHVLSCCPPILSRFDLTRVTLPPYSEQCYAQAASGGIDCDYPEEALMKILRPGLRDDAPAAYRFLQNFNYSTDDQEQMMAAVEVGGETAEEAARQWINANQAVWQAWIPAAPTGMH